METPNPGQVVSPNNAPQQPAEQPAQPEAPAVPLQQPSASVAPPDMSQPVPPVEYDMQFDDDGVISWTASEYIEHQKSPAWYGLLGLGGIAIAALAYFVTDGDITSVVVVVLAAIILGSVAARKPREQHYSISEAGVTIGHKTYGFESFKSFSVIEEGPFSSISFMPMKRFMPVISIYYDPQDEDQIVEALSAFLPIENRDHDLVDRFMKKIRF